MWQALGTVIDLLDALDAAHLLARWWRPALGVTVGVAFVMLAPNGTDEMVPVAVVVGLAAGAIWQLASHIDARVGRW